MFARTLELTQVGGRLILPLPERILEQFVRHKDAVSLSNRGGQSERTVEDE
jgi:hypothetical protein